MSRLSALNKQIGCKEIAEDYSTYLKQKQAEGTQLSLLNASETKRKSFEKKRLELNQKRKSVGIAIDSINKALEYIFFAKDRLSIELKNELYYLKSSGKYVKPKDVSSGERNIIALCYFFTHILNNQKTSELFKNEVLIIIDDPVSSFDFENKVGILSYINTQISNFIFGNSNSKVILLTHDLSVLFGLQKGINSLCRSANKAFSAAYLELSEQHLKNFEFKRRHEYSELLKNVFKFALSGNNVQGLVIGNEMRRILEAYATFNYRKGIECFSDDKELLAKLGSKAKYFENLLYRIVLHGESHFEEVVQELQDQGSFFSFLSDTEKQRTARDIICLLYLLDKQHLRSHLSDDVLFDENTVKEWCDSIQNLCENPPVDQNKYKRRIPLFDLPLSAGSGVSIDDSIQSCEDYEALNPDCDFALRISGDSMEPDIQDHAIVLIKKESELTNGTICAFFLDGEVFCKKISYDEKSLKMISINPHYDDIVITSDSSFGFYGRVVERLSPKFCVNPKQRSR